MTVELNKQKDQGFAVFAMDRGQSVASKEINVDTINYKNVSLVTRLESRLSDKTFLSQCSLPIWLSISVAFI